MLPVNTENKIIDHLAAMPVILELVDDTQLRLIADLDPDTPWADRKHAAEQLGNLGNPLAVPALIETLPADPFWMVRTAIIQALEKIGDQRAIPALHQVAETDAFKVVRAHATRAVERITE
jgi:HEAT repeat protein